MLFGSRRDEWLSDLCVYGAKTIQESLAMVWEGAIDFGHSVGSVDRVV